MRILHIYKTDNGGAGKAAIRLVNALNKAGATADTLTEEKIIHSRRSRQILIAYWWLFCEKVQRHYFIKRNNLLYSAKNETADFFSNLSSPYLINYKKFSRSYDIIHLHWIAGFVDLNKFLKYCRLPVVVTQHDMNYFTGGCHYSFGCKQFDIVCKICPQVDESYSSKVEQEFRTKKMRYSNCKNIFFVSPSRWLFELSSRSLLLRRFKHFCIPNCIPEIASVPNLLEIKDYILVIATDLDSKRKGGELLLSIIQNLLQLGYRVCMIGSSSKKIVHKNVYYAGDVYDESKLFSYYKNALVTLLPTLEDNLPNVLLESLSVGTPLIGFDTGGLRDFIKNGYNGFLVTKNDIDALIQSLKSINHLYWTRAEIKFDALNYVSEEVVANKYMDLYKMILSNETASI
jgi:glycosyltransferase involved in cell wall biosynthesis